MARSGFMPNRVQEFIHVFTLTDELDLPFSEKVSPSSIERRKCSGSTPAPIAWTWDTKRRVTPRFSNARTRLATESLRTIAAEPVNDNGTLYGIN